MFLTGTVQVVNISKEISGNLLRKPPRISHGESYFPKLNEASEVILILTQTDLCVDSADKVQYHIHHNQQRSTSNSK